MQRIFRAGRGRFWRFASVGRPVAAIIAAATLGACASARPEVLLPAPRSSASAITDPSTDSLETIEHAPHSVVTGSVRFLPRGAAPVDLGATVVYLRAESRSTDSRPASRGTVRIVSATQRFAPPPTLVRPGQRVVLENRGGLMHRLFTAALRDTPLMVDPEGRSKPFSLGTRGAIRFYCSLHADETFVVFVEDAEHAALVSEGREYAFGPVAPGWYTLAIWSERLSGPVRMVYVDGYTRTHESIWLVAELIER